MLVANAATPEDILVRSLVLLPRTISSPVVRHSRRRSFVQIVCVRRRRRVYTCVRFCDFVVLCVPLSYCVYHCRIVCAIVSTYRKYRQNNPLH